MSDDMRKRAVEETGEGMWAFVRRQASGVVRVIVDPQGAADGALPQADDSPAGCLFDLGTERAPDFDGFIQLLEPWLAQRSEKTIFGIRLRFSRIPEPETAIPHLGRLYDHGLRLIHWLKADGEDPIPRALLWQASKAGIWNHISGKDLFPDPDPSGTGAWIANNPNIAHSFESAGISSSSPHPGQAEGAPRALLTYGRLPDIPGVPFWQVLGDPERILAALGRTGARELSRLRAYPGGQETFRLGSGLEYHYKRPGEIDSRTMDEIVAMVDAGGSVDITHVRANLEKAYLIAYVTENGVIAGNSSLKHPRQVFIERLNRITGLDFTRFVERGYTSVRPEYRSMGIGAKLLEGLTCRATDVKVFSLISEDNLATQKIALRNNTRKIAVYYSEKVGKEMGVWMPESMIDTDWEIDL